MKKKRHRTIDPQKARAAAQGGLVEYIPTDKICSMCDKPRYSVDRTGMCGPCRVGKYDNAPMKAG